MSPFRPGSPLPIKASGNHLHHLDQRAYHPLGLPPALAAIPRNRPLSLAVALAVVVFLFVSCSDLSSGLLTDGPDYVPFQKTAQGLNRALWNDLRRIDDRSFVLRPVEREFKTERTVNDAVPWTSEPLLPPRRRSWFGWGSTNRGGKDGYEAFDLIRRSDAGPIPVHAIEAFPRKVALTPGRAGVASHVSSLEHMLFGIVTTTSRAKQMSKLWTNWMVPRYLNEPFPSCLILLSADEKQEDIQELESVLADRGLPCAIRQSSHERYEVRVMSMIVEMKEYAETLDKVDWFVFGDDDTFWVDIRAALRMLSKYDPREEWFIGTPSESHDALGMFGDMAFGGAGIFASLPLVKSMSKRWSECYEQFRNVFGGDEMLTRCAALARGVAKEEVTMVESGLHQFDIPGDTTGVLQSGFPVQSLHHYLGGGWVHLFGYGTNHTDFEQIQILQKVAPFLGGDNMFRRYVFGDGKWLFVNGYSITYFEKPLDKEDLSRMEHTWYEDYSLVFDDRPGVPERHGDKPAKQTFYIDDIKILSDKTAIMTYLQADSWDEHLRDDERVRLQVLWDGEHQATLRARGIPDA
ncbi:hypothetical protein JCM10212_005925 [Sporobolomyces blumeae]